MTLVFVGVWALSGSRYIFLGWNSRTSDLSEANCLEVSEVGEAETLQKEIPAPILSPHMDGFL